MCCRQQARAALRWAGGGAVGVRRAAGTAGGVLASALLVALAAENNEQGATSRTWPTSPVTRHVTHKAARCGGRRRARRAPRRAWQRRARRSMLGRRLRSGCSERHTRNITAVRQIWARSSQMARIQRTLSPSQLRRPPSQALFAEPWVPCICQGTCAVGHLRCFAKALVVISPSCRPPSRCLLWSSACLALPP